MRNRYSHGWAPWAFLLATCCSSRLVAQEKDSSRIAKDDQELILSTPHMDFKLSGGIYLFDYAPMMKGAKNDFSIYAFILKTDVMTKDKRFGLHVETRFRDTKLRPFYPSTVWFQEAYAFAHTNIGEVHVGKFYKKVGIFWDESFWGNILYFNGLTLHPEFGAELVGSKNTGGQTKINYSLQSINNNSHTDGALEGRDVESDTNAAFRYGFTARIAPSLQLGDQYSLTIGVSGLTGTIERTVGSSFQLSQMDGDVTFKAGDASVFSEILYQRGEKDDVHHPLSRPGYDNTVYYWGGVRYFILKKLLLRFSYSRAYYLGALSVEQEFLPGITYSIQNNLAIIVEYDYWKLQPEKLPSTTVDKSLNFVVNYNF